MSPSVPREERGPTGDPVFDTNLCAVLFLLRTQREQIRGADVGKAMETLTALIYT